MTAPGSVWMPVGLAHSMTVVDAFMLLFWGVTALAAMQVLRLPPDALYKGYDQPLLVAWNWSSMPIVVAFALTGLAAVRQSRTDRPWHGLALISLTLTMCAGAMAIGFWAVLGDFDPGWWLPNLVMLLGPLIWLPGIARRAR